MRLKQSELLKWFEENDNSFKATHPYITQRATERDKQAHEQIRELILREDKEVNNDR